MREGSDSMGVHDVGPAAHRIDTGARGCAEGLARTLRREVQARASGAIVVVTSTAPAADSDLPSLARLLGHTVRAVTVDGQGRTTVTLEVA